MSSLLVLVLPLISSLLVLVLYSVANAGNGVRVGTAIPIAYSANMVATLTARIWFVRCLTLIPVIFYP